MNCTGAAAVRCGALAALLLMLLFPALLRAQAPPSDSASKIASVKFSGSTRFAQDALARDIGLEPGKTVTRTDIQAAADRLAKLGWYEGIRYEFHTTSNGVEIQFTVTDAPSAPVWFDNFPWFSDAEIVRAIRNAGVLYDGTAPVGGTALDAMRDAIAGLLKSRNLPGEVEGEMIEAPESESMIERFRVTGANVRVAALEFTDPVAQQDPRIAAVVNTVVGKPYSRYVLAIFLVEHVRPAYTSHGYMRAHFGEPTALFSGDPMNPVTSEVTLRVPIEPGVQYHWGGAAWSGEKALDQATLNSLVGFSAGEPADALRMQAGWDRVIADYKKRGYLEAKLEPAPQFDDAAGRVSYAVKVTEGVQFHMGELVITGLSLAAERRLLANWKLARGDVFDNSYFEAFVRDGAQKLFEKTPVHFQHVGHVLDANPQTKTVDVKLDFQ
jgi:outer membrane protein assembly factor BamA